jgi:radical SAM protein with 4Fe4S-binding SPASM domain
MIHGVRPVPRFAGLELTLRCPYRCETCGSAAGERRDAELTTREWETVLTALGELGCERVTFLGGEPLTHPDWPSLAAVARSRGLQVDMVTSGAGLTPAVATTMARLGFDSVTVSIDGTESVHDQQRQSAGAFARALAAVQTLRERGLAVGVTTQLNSATLPTLEPLAAQLEAAGVLGWQVQHTLPTGRAQTTDLTFAAAQIPDVLGKLRELHGRRGLRPHLTDSVGYLTPDDVMLRTPHGMPPRAWAGCWAGIWGIGITSDGNVKGCLSIPDPFFEGNVREEALAEIWRDPDRFAYTRGFSPDRLYGACADCAYGRLCRAGCTALQLSVHGRLGTSVHCFRAPTTSRSSP